MTVVYKREKGKVVMINLVSTMHFSLNRKFCFGVLLLFFQMPVSAAISSSMLSQPPTLIANPSGNVPVAAVLRVELPGPVTSRVSIDDGERTWVLERQIKPSRESKLVDVPLLGMRPGRKHTITALFEDHERVSEQWKFHHQTPSLPLSQLEMPTVDLQVSMPVRMEPGVTFLTVRRRPLGQGGGFTPTQRAWFKDWGKVIAIDGRGEVVWWFETDKRVAGIAKTNEGTILVQRVTASTLEIDLMGNVLAEYYGERTIDKPTNPKAIKIAGGEVLHHQPHQMSTGNFLSFTAYATVFKDYPTSEIDPDAPRGDVPMVVDRLIEYERDGQVRWTWDILDHLQNQTGRFGYNTFWNFWNRRGHPKHADWSHGNGLSYDMATDSVLASFRNLSAVVSIDKSTSDINWLLGRHDGWSGEIRDKLLTPKGELLWPGYSHNPRVTSRGTVIMFDNRAHGGPRLAFEPRIPIWERFSRAVEFRVDPSSMTVEQIWTTGDRQNDDACYSNDMGDAHRLERTGNRLVIFAMCVSQKPALYQGKDRTWNDYPLHGRIIEYDGEEVVFKADIYDKDQLFSWEVYGGFRRDWPY